MADPVSFDADIKHLFRQMDVTSMMHARGFDLSKYADVSARADAILGRLKSGDMPCDAPWPDGQVALFSKWIEDGKKP
jgi:hypothetical protein